MRCRHGCSRGVSGCTGCTRGVVGWCTGRVVYQGSTGQAHLPPPREPPLPTPQEPPLPTPREVTLLDLPLDHFLDPFWTTFNGGELVERNKAGPEVGGQEWPLLRHFCVTFAIFVGSPALAGLEPPLLSPLLTCGTGQKVTLLVPNLSQSGI